MKIMLTITNTDPVHLFGLDGQKQSKRSLSSMDSDRLEKLVLVDANPAFLEFLSGDIAGRVAAFETI